MPKKLNKYHNERDSQFFCLKSRAKLASLLFTNKAKLQTLAREQGLYFQFKKPKSSGGFREISAPRDDLKAVQARIADLLQRIAPPDYLFALSLPLIPSCLPTTARLSGTDIILSQ